MEADLDRLHAGVSKRHAPRRPFVRLEQLGARDIREQALRAAAEELPQRLPRRLAEQVPDGCLDRPRPAAVEVDRLLQLADELRPERIETDENRLEQLVVGQLVAARPPRDAFVGVDADERRILVVPRRGIPGDVERRVEAMR